MNQKGFIPLFIILAIIFVIGITGGVYFFGKYQTPKTQSQISVITSQSSNPPAPTLSPSSLVDSKISMLKSSDLDTVIKGIAIKFIPDDKIKIEQDALFNYTFNAFGVPLNEAQYNKLLASLPSYRGPILTDIADLDSLSWKVQSEELHTALVKKGYICSIPSQYRTNTCGIGYSPCATKPFLGLICSNVKSPQDNTIANVSLFLLNSLKDSGIDCSNQTCKVEEGHYMELGIPPYFRHITFGEFNTDTKRVQKDVQTSSDYFSKAGWNVKTQDITKMEAGSLLSLKVVATNDRFLCSHTITSEPVKNNPESTYITSDISCALLLPSVTLTYEPGGYSYTPGK